MWYPVSQFFAFINLYFANGNCVKKLLEKLKEYNDDAIMEILHLDEEELITLLKKLFPISDGFICPHDKKMRAKRDDFYQEIVNYCNHHMYDEAKKLIFNKIKIAHCTEALFDKIKESLKDKDLSKQSLPIQCWAQIIRIENEIDKIKEMANQSLSNIKGEDNTIVVSKSYTIEYEGTSVNPDFLIEQLISSLALSLILLSHENKWFKSGELVFPACPDIIKQDMVSAGDITSLAIAWQKLSDASNRCILFSGDVFLGKEEDLLDEEWQCGINEIYFYQSKFSEFEKSDFIASRRLVDRSSQNFFETIIDYDLRRVIVDDIEKITSVDDGRYLLVNEIHALQELCKLYCCDITTDENEYEGLRIKEWVRGYSCLGYLSSKTPKRTYRKAEVISLLVQGGLDNGKAERFLKLTTFGIKSRDFYDKPLLLLDNGEYYLFHSILSGFSISSVVSSVFSQLEVEVKTKGKKFEESILNKLKQKNVKAESFKFKRGADEYEYDTVFVLDKRVFVVECKNRSISGWNSTRSARFSKFLSDTSKQVKRLVNGLTKYPEVFSEHFDEDISDFEVIPLIINCLPFSYAGKFEGVYVSDSSSFGKFFLSGVVSYDQYSGVNFEESNRKILHNFWSGNYPSSDDLIRHLENPIHLELYRNNIEEVISCLPVSSDTFFVINDLKADMHKGVEIKFGGL